MSAIVLLTDRHRYFLYTEATDMRKSFAGLCGIVTNITQLPITNNDIFVFLNRHLTQLKLLLHGKYSVLGIPELNINRQIFASKFKRCNQNNRGDPSTVLVPK
jgi:hypothetical protein